MTQERRVPAGTPGDVLGLLRSRRFLFVAGSVIVAAGIIGIVMSAVFALEAPLGIRAFIESEKPGNSYGPDFTATWLWAVVAAAGVAILIVGSLRGTNLPRRSR